MDLKDVVTTVKEKAEEAYNAYNAGHQETARNNLGEARTVIQAYLGEFDTTWGGELTKPTSEDSEEKTREKPEQVPGSPAQPTPGAAAVAGSSNWKDPQASRRPQ